ncbi:MAG: hypothetical protein ACC682_08230 [Gemmatimonadota bacterium]
MTRGRRTADASGWRSNWVTVAATALGLLAAGCGEPGGDLPEGSAAPIPPVAEGASAEPVVAVFLTEYTIDMPGVIDSGETRISVTNQGIEDHNLRITRSGSGEIVWQTDGNVGSGLTQESILDLPAGPYLAVCDFAGHDSRGMFMEIEVREASP